MRTVALLWLYLIGALALQGADNTSALAEADRYYDEGSYQRAQEGYALAAAAGGLAPLEALRVEFRRADSQWRALAATRAGDASVFEPALKELKKLAETTSKDERQRAMAAEARESLGDFYWTRRETRNWNEAWPHYEAALDWWAGARDIELGRKRYLQIVWRAVHPPGPEPFRYGNFGSVLPMEVLENTLKIATTDEDQALAHYWMAMTLRQNAGDWGQRKRLEKEFEAALRLPKSDWRDDALMQYANWLADAGRVLKDAQGNWTTKQDYTRALELYRTLTSEYQKGQTPYWDEARNRIESITGVFLGVQVGNAFLPGSEVQFAAQWRNVDRIDYVVWAIDLTKDLDLTERTVRNRNWLERVKVEEGKAMRRWGKDLPKKGDYLPGYETVPIDGKLPAGAYLLEARGGGKSARALILVSDATLVVKSSGSQALVYLCDALDGSPIAGGEVRLWITQHTDQTRVLAPRNSRTDTNGLARFEIPASTGQRELFLTAAKNGRQAYSSADSWFPDGPGRETWTVYALTDRAAYRPGETVKWKITARTSKGEEYRTPAGEKVNYEIRDARGGSLQKGEMTLNAFGSAWGTLSLGSNTALGPCMIEIRPAKAQEPSASSQLFRVEEYKLPEFRVSVRTPEENGHRKVFRSGDRVEAQVTAEYFFGGPVANAAVEVVVHRSPYYHWRPLDHQFPWFYEETQPDWWGRPAAEVYKRLTLRTDGKGEAKVEFDSDQGRDFEYSIEARVTDSSRREIFGTGTARVTRQSHFVTLRAEHALRKPGEKAPIQITTEDANGQPVAMDGKMKVTRERWVEVWIDPGGKRVTGEELWKAKQAHRIFPPTPGPDEREWQLKSRSYEITEITAASLKTGADGKAEFAFTPAEDGYYRCEWTSQEAEPPVVQAGVTVWVAGAKTSFTGYHNDSVEIIIDQDTFRSGEKAPVMLHTPESGRWVLFGVEGEELMDWQVVHLTGTTKLLELAIGEKHVPNFELTASMVNRGRLYRDHKSVVVPPVKQFLQVDIQPEKSEARPRDRSTFRITTKDFAGKPVSAEVALGISDAAIDYIQEDLAGDPRKVFYGRRREHRVNTQGSLEQMEIVLLAKNKEGFERQSLDIDQRRRAGRASEEREEELLERRSLGRQQNESLNFDGLADTKLGARYGLASRGGGPAKMMYKMARPLDAAAARPAAAMEMLSIAGPGSAPAAPPTPAMEITVRTDFRSTMFWQPDVVTGNDGTAVVEGAYPDGLTKWCAKARAATKASQFGVGSAETTTTQPLLVRLEGPRFFTAGDLSAVSAVIHNKTKEKLDVRQSMIAEGLVVTGIYQDGEFMKGELPASVSIPAEGEARIDWAVKALESGNARIQVKVQGGNLADAAEKTWPIHEHGIDKLIAASGRMDGEKGSITLRLPKERKRRTTTLMVQATPSLAVTMLDALPYLIDYPYGCTEQTMSRFLPAVLVAKTLADLGLKREEVAGRIFGGIEQGSATITHPNGKRGLEELDRVVKAGLERLKDMRHPAGGWGWWKDGADEHFMSAYVVWGLALARQAGVEVPAEMVDQGAEFLLKSLIEEKHNPDVQAWMLHALAVHQSAVKRKDLSEMERTAFEQLWRNRDALNTYGRALLALSAHHFGRREEALTLARNLENGVKRDASKGNSALAGAAGDVPTTEGLNGETAHWGADGLAWRWSESAVEATAFAVRALLEIDPGNKLIEPAVLWLVKNRRGAQWSNTRDTAITLLTLSEYVRKNGQLTAEGEFEISVNGTVIATQKFSKATTLGAPSRFAVKEELIRDGANEITLKRTSGSAPLHLAAEARFFSEEEPVTPTGHELFVKRRYYRLKGRPTLLKGHVYDRILLKDGEKVMSGDRIETVLTIEAKNDSEYLLVEDLKPAGFESTELRSGDDQQARELKEGKADKVRVETGTDAEEERFTGREERVHQELRDQKVALFVGKLPTGLWEIRYEFRAETPGDFHALPAVGQAMYTPEIRGNSEEIRVSVGEEASKKR